MQKYIWEVYLTHSDMQVDPPVGRRAVKPHADLQKATASNWSCQQISGFLQIRNQTEVLGMKINGNLILIPLQSRTREQKPTYMRATQSIK